MATFDLETCLRAAGAVPVVTLDDPARGPPLARALLDGGLGVIEVTLRTPAALDGAAAIRREVPEMTVGLGTVLSPADLERAVAIGAHFAVSPGLTASLSRAAAGLDIAWLPGVASGSEIMRAMELGHDVLKFFPAGAAGGVAALKSLAAPFAHIRFCPTGGIGRHNMADYLALPNVLCVGGGWLAPAPALALQDWRSIAALAREARAAVAARTGARTGSGSADRAVSGCDRGATGAT